MTLHERARFNLGGIGLPYYYLPDKFKSSDMQSVASINRRGTTRDVISCTSSGVKKCFFGITKTKYWTSKTTDLFKEKVNEILEEEPESFCGDGNCDESEDCECCPEDCGECPEIICSLNSDCGEDGYLGEDYCSEGNAVRDYVTYTCNNPGTEESFCSDVTAPEIIEECDFGCEEGICLEEEIPEEPICGDGVLEGEEECDDGNLDDGDGCSSLCLIEVGEDVHDVLIDETYGNTVNGIRIKDAGGYITEDPAQLNCGEEYEIKSRIKNVGDFSPESTTISGSVNGIEWDEEKDINIQSYFTNDVIFENSGSYTINILAEIENDANPEDNSKSRQIEVVC